MIHTMLLAVGLFVAYWVVWGAIALYQTWYEARWTGKELRKRDQEDESR